MVLYLFIIFFQVKKEAQGQKGIVYIMFTKVDPKELYKIQKTVLFWEGGSFRSPIQLGYVYFFVLGLCGDDG